MYKLVFAPHWFSGIDCIFEVVAVIVTFLIAMYVYKLYKFSKDRQYQYFSYAFLAIAFSFIFKILTNITIYGEVLEKHSHGLYHLTFKIIQRVDLLYTAGHLLHRFLFLMGLLGIFCIIGKLWSPKQIILNIFLISLVTIFSAYKYFAFYLTSTLILAFIVHSLYKNHKAVCNKKTFCITTAFYILLISQIAFIFVVLSKYIYVVAEVIQLAGFVMLLAYYYMLAKK